MRDILLSICIPTVVGREVKCEKLLSNIRTQILRGNFHDVVETIIDKDNKEVSIGAKRDRMYKRCNGMFSVQIDDDDDIAEDYIETFMNNYNEDVDCYGYQELCTFDGKTQKKSDFTIRCKEWHERPDNGFHHFRTPFCKTPIKTTICKFVGVKDIRFGEDHDFAKRIFPYLRNEKYIDKIMYYYKFESEEHKKKYGIK
jgi:hypothetical protein